LIHNKSKSIGAGPAQVAASRIGAIIGCEKLDFEPETPEFGAIKENSTL
jgi:hypothetical protein